MSSHRVSNFVTARENMIVIMVVTLDARLGPLVVRHKEVFGHGDQPDRSEEKAKCDGLGHDTHDVLCHQLLLLQPILGVLTRQPSSIS